MNTAATLPILLAVVGHTNTGKTSLVRTLLRNSQFGEVQDAAGTTRHVESAQLLMEGEAYIELRDTPGLEDSIALFEQLQGLENQGYPGRQCLEQFIAQGDRHPEFEQEIKVLKQALACDALLYIVDCREPVFAKYRQEIQSLSLASRPILPVLNFVHAQGAQLQAWRDALAELRLHALVEFDTVAFDFNSEKRLYQKLQVLLEPHYDHLQYLMDQRAEQWQQLREACVKQVARLLVDVTQFSIAVDKTAPTSAKVERLRDFVRSREQECLNVILELLQFKDLAVELPNLPITDGEWQADLFSPEALKTFGLDTASAAATGAAIGAGVDLFLAGISLGAASATGAAIGAAWNASRRYGRDFLAKLSGQTRVGVDDTTMELLLLRQLLLLRTLFARGHAAQGNLKLVNDVHKKLPAGWQDKVKKVRGATEDYARQRVERELQEWVERAL